MTRPSTGGDDGDDLDVEDLDAPRSGAGASTIATVVEVGGRRRRGAWVLGGVAVVGVVVALATSGDDDGGATARPTTTDRSTPIDVPRTSAPLPTRVEGLGGADGRPLPGIEGFDLIVAIPEGLVRVDLGDGSITPFAPAVDVELSYVWSIAPAGGILGQDERGAFTFVGDDGRTVALQPEAQPILSPDGRWVWAHEWNTGRATRFRPLDGPERWPTTPPANSRPVAALDDGTLLLQSEAGLHRYAVDSSTTFVAPGQFVAVDAQRLVTMDCDVDLRCAVAVRDLVGGQELRRTAVEGAVSSGALSPDGTLVAMASRPDGTMAILDLTTGTIRERTSEAWCCGAPTWAPDSRTLLRFDGARLSLLVLHDGGSEEWTVGLDPLQPNGGALVHEQAPA